MPPSSPTDRLADGFSPSPLPPIQPDGSLSLEPAPLDAPARQPISLCTLGPCLHYHELESKIDAQDPLDGSRTAAHVITTRACYPHPGIEMELTQPVKRCNLWKPTSGAERGPQKTRLQLFCANNEAALAEFHRSWGEEGGDHVER